MIVCLANWTPQMDSVSSTCEAEATGTQQEETRVGRQKRWSPTEPKTRTAQSILSHSLVVSSPEVVVFFLVARSVFFIVSGDGLVGSFAENRT